MKYLLIVLLPLAIWLGTAKPANRQVQTSKPEQKTEGKSDDKPFVLLELFTSQGCSSCPPADEQLARLAKQSSEELPVYALSYHVDYWNYLGWEDPFSDARFSERQRSYAGSLRSRVYTPQLVVNGQAEMIGSRQKETTDAVAEALDNSNNLPLTFKWKRSGDNIAVDYTLDQENLLDNSSLVALVAQKEASSQVVRGENRGRKLKHVNVVRSFFQAPLSQKSGQIELGLPDDIGAFEIVLFIQKGKSGRVLAVNATSVVP